MKLKSLAPKAGLHEVPMHRNVQVIFLVASSLALGIILSLRSVAATAGATDVAVASPAAAVPAGMADRFYNEKTSASVEPLPAQF